MTAAEKLAQAIADGCGALGQIYDEGQLRQFVTLLSELERWSRRINLTAIRDSRDMVSGHLLDSLAVRGHLHGTSIIDIGTGAGFPGLPLAIAEPQREFVLLDSNDRKIGFVRHMIMQLGLRNATAVRSRAEGYAPGRTFDTVIARALAAIPRVIELGGHLTGKKGVLLALKGKYPADELEQAEKLSDRWGWQVSEIGVPGLEQHARHVVRLKRKD